MTELPWWFYIIPTIMLLITVTLPWWSRSINKK